MALIPHMAGEYKGLVPTASLTKRHAAAPPAPLCSIPVWQFIKFWSDGMKRSFWLTAALYVLLCGSAPSPARVEDRATEEGVRAVEIHWQNAFTHGDRAYLEGLLTDDYVSVNAKGVARDRNTIVQLSESYAKKKPASENGDVAVLRHGGQGEWTDRHRDQPRRHPHAVTPD